MINDDCYKFLKLDNVGASVDYNNFGNVSSYIIYDGKICSNNEIKHIKNDILKRIPVYTDSLDVISSYIVNDQRNAKIRNKLPLLTEVLFIIYLY